MLALGDYAPASIIDLHFPTHKADGTPIVLTGSPAISVYKGNSATQSTSGVTLDTNFDSVTGLNHVRIDTSSDGTFYAAGGDYSIVITAGTVDSISVVGAVVGRFTLARATLANVDGVLFNDYIMALMATTFNVATPTGSTVNFKKRDGTTTKVSITYGSADGERTASTIS